MHARGYGVTVYIGSDAPRITSINDGSRVHSGWPTVGGPSSLVAVHDDATVSVTSLEVWRMATGSRGKKLVNSMVIAVIIPSSSSSRVSSLVICC